jgi:pre-mRNA-splicing factor ISY1
MEDSMERAQGWRMEIVRDVAKMIAEIQNENLDQHRVRDLNDQINKKMRLKRAWEHRVVELGGPNYLGVHPTQFDDPGIAPDMKGGAYRYYGAAKKLPGVRELLEAAVQNESRAVRTMEQLQRSIDVGYYGYLDDADGVLEKLEAVAEKRALEERIAEWEENTKKRKVDADEAEEAAGVAAQAATAASSVAASSKSAKSAHLHLNLPSQKEIDALILERKKKDLLRMYASDELLEQLEAGQAAKDVITSKK